MSYAGFCEVCNTPYYEADAIQHQHGEAEQANAEINKKFAPQVEALRKEIERTEAAAQKVEQPAVEPQQFCPVCSFGWDGIKCKFCHHEKSDEIKPEAGSTRPEMPPSPWLMCKCGYGKIHHEGKDLVCPNNFGGVLTVFSEADNVPPANELKALDALEQMVASARTHYSRNHDDSPPFPYEIVLSVANYGILQSATKVVAEALRERASHVQQEPLNNETKKRDAIAWMEDAERWLLNPTKPNISNAAISIKQAIVTLKSQPAAPRTQGREWKRQESYPECDGDGCNNCAPEDWAWAAAHELIFPDDECGDRYSDVDTKEAAKVIRKHFDLAQARTQPAPRTTLPDHYKFADEWVGKHYVHKYPTQVISDIPVMDAVQMLADFVQQFFTALPAATKEEK